MQRMMNAGLATVAMLLLLLSAGMVSAAEKITTVQVKAHTTTDDKEDSQFEVVVKQGQTEILHLKRGAGEDWNNGDKQEFNEKLDVDVNGQNIEIICALQDGDYGRSNHWNCTITVTIRTSEGREIKVEKQCAFRTKASRRRHEINFGTHKFGSK
ncbi:hypothetical protein [Blastopirellula retiformator]|uniref:PLAT domain-containing protein n=1 Tax=Blastopirellula retiformator TaxID=2527970 RepID=A0A5C5V734_9BACT|nr:hypothetical protein [Blastopirellula retiformator]TWT34336.1 hypothetical protein Enr8_17300 [Blastopirellula retiformator]